MEIKRGSTANESITCKERAQPGICGRKWHLRRRDVRTAAICKAMRKRALPWSGVVADVRLRSFGLEASMGTAKHAVAPYRFSTVRSRWSKSLTIPKGKPWPSLSGWLPRARRSSAPRIRGLCPIDYAVGSRPRRCAATGMRFRLLDENVETVTGQISIGTMHLAPGFGISRRSGYGL
jgi:hypothetical protein